MNTQKKQNSFFRSTSARMLMIGLLILTLLIPLTYVRSLINERASRQQSVVHEINEKWGEEVMLYGPILRVPYKTYEEKIVLDKEGKESKREQKVILEYAYFFPEKIENEVRLDSDFLHRNNFETVVYTADMNVSGQFNIPDFKPKGIKDEDILWEKANILIRTSNLKGIKDELSLQMGTSNYSFQPIFSGNRNNNFGLILDTLESSTIGISDLPVDKPIDFSFVLKYKGSERLSFIPIGRTTEVKIGSDWHSPSFSGTYLPDDKTKVIDENGFKAEWKILQVNRPFSQQAFKRLPNLDGYAFGVDLIMPIDEYQKSERSAKYGYLVIALTFLVFFLIQTMSKIYIHPFQYLMIGLALLMFYTLLISISEHSTFLKAYLIAASAVVVLITTYSKTILGKLKFPLLICASLSSLYTFIYVIIQLENYALLVGSIGLFGILAIVMFASRKIDWSHD
ncbi:cell envelope integrity protein CreD [Leptobacterium flavescens]|uniref:Cell envelope integrity protein CreD n=1 Tax=Leptobacterium flavescens TaxID=472055 RepID=A0A6P0URY5_9FLAO|nr:cell envelope integrity protein CreD [Leptobacterium flavescens]NER15280.1 cell envelope integrity protein CreD [Leptobacterium flavescens]